MFNFGFWEIILIIIVALLVLGPKQLPEVARIVGKSLAWLRRSTENIKNEFEQHVDSVETSAKKPMDSTDESCRRK